MTVVPFLAWTARLGGVGRKKRQCWDWEHSFSPGQQEGKTLTSSWGGALILIKWEYAMKQNVSWQDICSCNPQRIKFLIQEVWLSSRCSHGSRLSSQPVAFVQGQGPSSTSWTLAVWDRAKDQILESIAEAISKGIKDNWCSTGVTRTIRIVTAG